MVKRNQEASTPAQDSSKPGKMQKYSVAAYLTVLFIVMSLLIMISYFMQLRDSKALEDRDDSLSVLAAVSACRDGESDAYRGIHVQMSSELEEIKKVL